MHAALGQGHEDRRDPGEHHNCYQSACRLDRRRRSRRRLLDPFAGSGSLSRGEGRDLSIYRHREDRDRPGSSRRQNKYWAMPNLPTVFGQRPRAIQPSASARGYGWSWQKLRREVLTGEPLCRLCRAEGRVTAATQVDHIRPKGLGGTDDRSNLQPICDDHHRAKTITDRVAIRAASGAYRPQSR